MKAGRSNQEAARRRMAWLMGWRSIGDGVFGVKFAGSLDALEGSRHGGTADFPSMGLGGRCRRLTPSNSSENQSRLGSKV